MLFVTRPDHDTSNYYLYLWSKEIIDLCKTMGNKVIDLKGKRANKKEVVGILSKKSPELLFFNGHGSETEIYGYNDEVLIKLKDNHQLICNKIVYARSCQSAKELGKEVANNGGTYIGYVGDFMFPVDSNKSSTPLKDKLAAPVLEASNEVMINLVKGKSPKEAYDKSQKRSLELFYKLAHSEVPIFINPTLWALISNRQNQVLLE